MLIWLQLFVAVFFSFGILWYVSIPAFLLIGIQFPRLIECWKLYGYSKRFAHGSTAIVLALFFLTANHTSVYCLSFSGSTESTENTEAVRGCADYEKDGRPALSRS